MTIPLISNSSIVKPLPFNFAPRNIICDSLGFRTPGCGLRIDPRYWVQDSTSVDSGFQKICFPEFRIPQVNVSLIPDTIIWTSDPRYWIQDSTSVDSEFQKVCVPGFQIPRGGFQIQDSKEQDSELKE